MIRFSRLPEKYEPCLTLVVYSGETRFTVSELPAYLQRGQEAQQGSSPRTRRCSGRSQRKRWSFAADLGVVSSERRNISAMIRASRPGRLRWNASGRAIQDV